MAKPWIMNVKRIVEKIRDTTQLFYLRLDELVAEAYIKCPNCQHCIDCSEVPIVWPKLPAGVKFDPSDLELIQHLEEKSSLPNLISDVLINEFIPTIEEQGGICNTHPQNLPGIKTDGSSRHFFHRISNAYSCGQRKRRKINNYDLSVPNEMKVRWHKTGKSKKVYDENGVHKGWKKILVLYTVSKKGEGKTEKTGWVMHQYHLGADEDEKDGELLVSKVFYQPPSKKIDKSEMDASVVEHDASTSTAKIDPRTPKTDPPQPHRPNYSPCEMEQYTPPFLPDQGEAESSASNSRVKNEDEYPVWYDGLSQIFEDMALPDMDEANDTWTQTQVSESVSGSGVRTFLASDAGPSSRLGKRSWESGIQVTPDEPTQCNGVTENCLQQPMPPDSCGMGMYDGLPDLDYTASYLVTTPDYGTLAENFYSPDAERS